MLQVISYHIFNQKGANTAISLLLSNGTVQTVVYSQAQLHHFTAACIMLQTPNVWFEPITERFELQHVLIPTAAINGISQKLTSFLDDQKKFEQKP